MWYAALILTPRRLRQKDPAVGGSLSYTVRWCFKHTRNKPAAPSPLTVTVRTQHNTITHSILWEISLQKNILCRYH